MADEIGESVISFKWNKHSTTFFNVLSTLRNHEAYTDATLACDGKFYPIHKLVLSACSDYFFEIFGQTHCRSPVVVLKDIRNIDLEALLDFMYNGEVDILQNELPEFMKAAECLCVKGLGVSDEEDHHFMTPKKDFLTDNCDVYCKFSPDERIATTSIPYGNVNNSLLIKKEYSGINERSLSPPTKRMKRMDQLITYNEATKCMQREDQFITHEESKKEIFLKSPPSILKPLNAIEVPLQFQSASSKSPIFTQLNLANVLSPSNLKIPSYQTSESKRKGHLVQKKRSRSANKLKIDKEIKNSNHVKLVRKRKRNKGNVKPIVSSDSQRPNKNVFYVNHEASDPSDEMENSDEENLSQKLNFSIPGNITLTKLPSQPGTSTLSPKKKVRNRKIGMTAVATVDIFLKEIGLPNFSTELIPYLEGHELEEKTKLSLENLIVKEVLEHWNIHKMLDRVNTGYQRGLLYYKYQLIIMDKYPNIIQAEDNRKKKRRGPLSYLFDKLATKINRIKSDMRKSVPQNSVNGDQSLQGEWHHQKKEESNEEELIDHENRMKIEFESFGSDNGEEFPDESHIDDYDDSDKDYLP